MFERYLTDALTTHFGRFVENLDADKVRLSAWSGELVFRDLSLKSNALDHLMPDCPVELAHGSVGVLELRIPWSLFRSQLKFGGGQKSSSRYLSTTAPCSIVLSDVNILITPRRRTDDEVAEGGDDLDKDSPTTSTEERRVEKEKEVQSLLDGHLLRLVTESSGGGTLSSTSSSSSRWAWVQDWLSTLLSTLSVTVRNIHIRYEDPGTCMGLVWDSRTTRRSGNMQVPRSPRWSTRQYRPSFAVGITLRQLSVQSDEGSTSDSAVVSEVNNGESNEKPKSSSSTLSPRTNSPDTYRSRRKIAAAEHLAIYWDSGCNLMAINAEILCRERPDISCKSYFQSAFAVVNSTIAMTTAGISSGSFEHHSLYSHQHSYVLDPISPFIKLNLISAQGRNFKAGATTSTRESIDPMDDDLDDSSNDGSTVAKEPQHIGCIPPSAIQVHLPPCKFTLDRSTLEDTAYVRKSLSIWKHSKKGILSEATLRRLAKLRPTRSPNFDPRSWWHYAVEASLTLSQVNRPSKAFPNGEHTWQRCGWRSFWISFQRRKRYLELCQCLVPSENGAGLTANDPLDLDEIHRQLLDIEDSLRPEEIVAFRLALYQAWKSSKTVAPSIRRNRNERVSESSSRSWAIWSKGANENYLDQLQDKAPVLSLEHRVAMMHEMSLALEREKMNAQKSAQAISIRQMSVRAMPAVIMDVPSEVTNSPVVWKASVACTEIAIQINDDSFNATYDSLRRTPVIRFSCAWLQEQRWFEDESWEVDCSLASLVVKDLTLSGGSLSQRHFPNLIAGKSSRHGEIDGSEYVTIEDQRHHKSISIEIQRRLHWSSDVYNDSLDDTDRGSTTTNRIIILPMEVVYSTVPVEVATRVLGTVKTPELVDDYHRMAAAAHSWQERQKKKILAALAHKRKKIIVDVDVGAPEFLIPENIDQPHSPMLAVDLGHLRLRNDEPSADSPSNYDDHWRFIMSDIQVRSANVAAFAQDASISERSLQAGAYRQLLEPFSLNFAIATKIASEDKHDQEDQTKIRVGATLPRLAFNLNSSAIRLISRLQSQFESRRKGRKLDVGASTYSSSRRPGPLDQPFLPASLVDLKNDRQDLSSGAEERGNRVIQFDFTAPVISLRLGSDTGDIPRALTTCSDEVALLDLAFHGIRGSLIQNMASNGESTSLFNAKLHSVTAIDLFQTAGNDFALLLSSSAKASVYGDDLRNEAPSGTTASAWDWEGKDLVTIQYRTCSSSEAHSVPIPKKLLIRFHELYVEWNSETIANIQKAVRIPSQERAIETMLSRDTEVEEEFFDALEDVSFTPAEDDDSCKLVSEVASSSFETADSDVDWDVSGHTRQSSFSHSMLSLPMTMSNGSVLSPPRGVYSSVAPLSPHSVSYPQVLNEAAREFHGEQNIEGFELTFELSKLRVSFNKESRHRKLIIAQMDGTSVSYETRKLGGSMTKMKIGNLVFTDPGASRNATLYGDILGLKSKVTPSANVSSLLEMDILINPRMRSYVDGLNPDDDKPDRPVSIDRQSGVVNGCNNFVKARFSPMRFVFLEQLWFEFIDYFFEGIIGTPVWSGRSSALPAALQLPKSTPDEWGYIVGADAEGLSFTRFLLELESPEVLLPVTYRSPQFLRLDLGGIHISNRYNTSVVDDTDRGLSSRIQWFNNCAIALDHFRLFSWTGRELGKNPVAANMTLRWPTGPCAQLVTPKWNVLCHFESLRIALRRSDYALVQHIISMNIGEASRHMDEWEALQRLSPPDFLAYSSGILVHFGYDKKDVTPTTYDLKITIPSLSAEFIVGDDDGIADTVAVARCSSLSWILRKDSDLVVKQKATFNVILVAPSPSDTADALLSSWKYDQTSARQGGDLKNDEVTPELTYTSKTLPDGQSVKTLEIADASIYSNITQWRRFTGFFPGLPEPSLFTEEEIGSSIQVGDRWYKIGNAQPKFVQPSATDRSSAEFSWIATCKSTHRVFSEQEIREVIRKSNVVPASQLRMTLRAPQIVLSSGASDGTRSYAVLRMSHLDFLQSSSDLDDAMTRSFFLHEVEVFTVSSVSRREGRPTKSSGSLIHPWSVGGTNIHRNGGDKDDLTKDNTLISADILKARATYSDITIALEVCLSVAHSAEADQRQPEAVSKIQPERIVSSSSTTPCKGAEESNSSPVETRFHADCEGFELLVTDDSGRHFASNQDLITLSLGRIVFSRQEGTGKPSAMHLRVDSFDLHDDLQNDNSSFKMAATTRPAAVWTDDSEVAKESRCENFPRRYSWNDFEMKIDGSTRFKISPHLTQRLEQTSDSCSRLESNTIDQCHGAVDLSRLVDETQSQKYVVKLRSLSVQYNPSTVIAIQRFLGRLRKESGHKIANAFENEVVETLAAAKSDLLDQATQESSESVSTKIPTVEMIVELDAFSICLNKEHQNRRLLELKLSHCRLGLHSSSRGTSSAGLVGSLAAWDPDTHSQGILESNRDLLRVTASGSEDIEDMPFLKFQYNTFTGAFDSKLGVPLPTWVRHHIDKIGGIDDFLSVKVASTHFIFLKERTEELIDYLSNGLPGKGMGVTSRAAKGFISKRILTRSFLEFQNDSPQVFIPRDELSPHGISLKLGKFWFAMPGFVLCSDTMSLDLHSQAMWL